MTMDNDRRISFERAKQLMEEEPDHLIVDVREEEEYITGHAEGAVLLTLDTIRAETAAAVIPDRDTLLLIYCRSGRRSRQAAERLAALGYTRVYDMGGLIGWPYGMAW